jgi:hypothetical protein
MFATQLGSAIAGARTDTTLHALAKALWGGLAQGLLDDETAQELSAAIEGRRGEIGWPPVSHPSSIPSLAPVATRRQAAVYRHEGQTLFARARAQRPPDRAAAITRRRRLAASGPLPPRLAAQFTTGELAVLRVVADEVRDKGMCDRTYAEMAARAGVCRRTARNAVRRAKQLGLVNVEERSRPGRKHLANLITLISKEWRMWLDRGPARGRVPVPANVRPGSRPIASAQWDRGQKISSTE